MQAHGACASSHMVRWHRHVCSIYTKLRKPKRYVFWFKSSGPMAHSLLQGIQNRPATKNVHSLEV